MARKPRQDAPGAIHHVFGRGNHKQPIFRSDEDKAAFLHRLVAVKKHCRFELHCFCLLDNHYHLLVRTGPVSLSKFMHRILTGYSMALNERKSSPGHVFQGRFGSSLCEDHAYYQWLVRYIHLNPVEAGLAASPDGWVWSSHAAFVGTPPGYLDIAYPMSVLGSVEGYRDLMARSPDPITAPVRRSLAEIGYDVAQSRGVDFENVIAGSRGAASAVRREVMLQAAKAGFKQNDIAAFLNCTQAAVSKALSYYRGLTPEIN